MSKHKNDSAQPKLFPDQLDDEELLLVFRKHPVVMRKGLILFMIGPLLGVLPAAIWPELGFAVFYWGIVVGFALGFALFFYPWVAWYYSLFIVTDQRFIQITQKGLFHRSVVDIGLPQIQMVNYEVDGIEQTLLGFGTITMQTYMGELVVHNIHHPARIQKKIMGILRDRGVVTGPAGPAQSTKESYSEA